MNRIEATFRRLRDLRRCALVPFVTAGDPDLATTESLLAALVQNGADVVELGVPYSDPIADGPVIQASYTRALEKGVRLDRILETVDHWATGHAGKGQETETPLVSMVSYSIVLRHGLQRYVSEAAQAGFSGAIVPDLPIEESAELARITADHNFSLIQLITPTTPPARAERIAATSSGFIYYVSVTGITGERIELPEGLAKQVQAIRNMTDLPVCVGFGISRPEQARALRDVADGIIVGSALVRRVAAATGDTQRLVDDVGRFVAELSAALTEES